MIEVEGVDKRFGVVHALRDVSLSVEAGTIHALVGENGAGKSTLGKVIAGVHTPDGGQLLVDGAPRRYGSPRDALADGVTIIAQELALVPRRTVAENVFLGGLPRRAGLIDVRALRRRYEELGERAGFEPPPGDELVGNLRLADQQKTEILRGIAQGARLIVMDEPTAALTHDQATGLFRIVRALREQGTTVVYVSHFLKEVLDLADAVTVLRDGRVIETQPAAEATENGLISQMIGRSLDVAFPPRHPVAQDAPKVLCVRGLSAANAVEDITFDVRAGEVLGIAGLVGSGRSELAHAISGALRPTAGAVELDGEAIALHSPADAIRLGIALLPESRKAQGLLLSRSIAENVSLPHLSGMSRMGVVTRQHERRDVGAIVERLGVRAPSIETPVRNLSGGNQQKVLFAKWLMRPPKLLLADEPTRGVDVGAKRAIYDLIVDLARQGMAIVLISSELEEVVALSHRVCVMRAGRLVATLGAGEVTEEAVMNAAFDSDSHGGVS